MFKVDPMSTKTLSWWYDERDKIDFEPVYQRKGRIWSKKDKSYLIDTILNNFDFPKIYLADFTIINSSMNKKGKSYAVVDGKQRFEAIFDFFDNKLTLEETFIFYEEPVLKLGGLSLKDLRGRYPKIARKFENFNLTPMAIHTDDESKINELFVRLNTSKPLVGAEIRNAMKGVVPGLIRDLANCDFFSRNIAFSTPRAQDKNVAAKLLLIEFRGQFVETKKRHLDALVGEGEKAETTNTKDVAARVRGALEKMGAIFTEKDPLLRSQASIPIYYWLVRNHSALHLNRIREFLVSFEKYRKENKLRSRTAGEKTDEELNQFEIWSRSVNDQASMSGRYAVLERRFLEYISRAR